MEDNGFIRRVFRKKKVIPTNDASPSDAGWRAPVPMSSTSTLRPLIRKKIIKPFIPEQIPTTTSLPALIPTEQNALNRSQDDPRCKWPISKAYSVTRTNGEYSFQSCRFSPSSASKMTLVFRAPEVTGRATAPRIAPVWAEQPQGRVHQDLECAVCVSW